ncbi:ANR family transcriptional regulator [Aggregatibacter actinomycetemcomitans]|uniref:ANR family transcriptional regulator n=1 Tax=Aggregatibacter actinomycetemcomitans TaxID=714 RepID=UPI00023FEF1B|nr:ANR family transcriptional regulator [Aggregatibacter actinomycetemcomitans]EHK89847.1 hypothetical protein RHAA1_10936 [Aggregatibacter actinomycetemcomitans RhAA1]KNE76940.1 hypothetical protein RHAA2_11250 [Aggregatibacter actinomycetemcomitans RhAA1]
MEMTYKDLSKLAVEVERAGDLSYASQLWFKAANLAKKTVNQQWAINRGEFCKRWHPRSKKEDKKYE